MRVILFFGVLLCGACSNIQSNADMKIKPPSYADCKKVPDLWKKAQVEISLSCQLN